MIGKQPGDWRNSYRRWFYCWLVKKYLQDCRSFLDVGCGRALFLECVPSGAIRAGIDAQIPDNIEQWKRDVIRCQPYDQWQNPVDCVFASQFLEHVEGGAFFIWASKVCKRKLVIITPRPTASFWDDPDHKRPYTRKAVADLCKSHGFKVLWSRNLYPTSSHITVAQREPACS
ncbi:hypothetical protein HY642_01630 [Candidatus Woesearchaeota archaeon]|nr:hypothetical protein [Candidatus Woesearchaeota archaeon]